MRIYRFIIETSIRLLSQIMAICFLFVPDNSFNIDIYIYIYIANKSNLLSKTLNNWPKCLLIKQEEVLLCMCVI